MRQGIRSIIVPVDEAEALVDRFRQQGDWSRQLGVPAHLTLVGALPLEAELPWGELAVLATAAIGTRIVLDRISLLGGSICLLPADEEPLMVLAGRILGQLGPEVEALRRQRIHLTVWREAPTMLPEISSMIEPSLPIESAVRIVCVATVSRSGSLKIDALAGRPPGRLAAAGD
jgi:hypothetical protein